MKTDCRFPAVGFSLIAALTVSGQPKITKQPTNQSVSLGASVVFEVLATSTNPPLAYQWRHVEAEIAGATNRNLTLTNISMANNGRYTAAVSDRSGTTMSDPAILEVDATFTKIMTNALVTEKAHWHCAGWGDYDNDGYPDLFIHRVEPSANDLLFHNNRDGTFTRVVLPVTTTWNGVWGCAWGDYDNDGRLDLFLADGDGQNVFLRNRGDATFERILTGPGTGRYISTSAVWGDYDRDGFLDLFLVNSYGGMGPGSNLLCRNQGDGTFLKLTAPAVGDLMNGSAVWMYASWVDYDDDGWPDVFTTDWKGAKTYLYRNLGNGRFSSVTNCTLVSGNLSSMAYAWGDYDNDGRLDVLLAMDAVHPDVLFHNEGAGVFRRMTAAEVGPVASDSSGHGGAAWGDYDNDGFLDLFVAGGWDRNGDTLLITTNYMYHNNGDGAFRRLTAGSPANDVGNGMGVYWLDYDRDGFLDLFIQNHSETHCLYRNNGNANAWLEVNCVGTSSPRFGTGAKVRAKAIINGQPIWQLRLIDAGGTCWGGQSFVAHFGLGDATNVEVLRLEWPSGIVQELHNVSARQHLTVTEPPKLEVCGCGQFRIRSWQGMTFQVQTSTNLLDWRPAAIVTNLTGSLEFSDSAIPDPRARFYRVLKP